MAGKSKKKSKGKDVARVLSAKAVLFCPAGRIFLMREAVYDGGRYPGKWDCPGGRFKDGENLSSCLSREVFEECEIEIEGYLDDYRGMQQTHTSLVKGYTLLGKTDRYYIPIVVDPLDTKEIVLSKDHSEYEWMHINKMLSLMLDGQLMQNLGEVILRFYLERFTLHPELRRDDVYQPT